MIQGIFNNLLRKYKKKNFRRNLHSLNIKERFSQIYAINYWGHGESASGKGSTLEHTGNLRKELPLIFKELNIGSVFDAPCGDFHWMRHVVANSNIQYIGADIVSSLIESHNSLYQTEKISFLEMDLTNDKFPKADLMLCRDCLFHLSFSDTKKLLTNFLNSDIKYLLTTTYKNNDLFKNRDIESGHFRLIDLFSSPYNFPKPPIKTIDDWLPPDHERYMCLWTRESIKDTLINFIKT